MLHKPHGLITLKVKKKLHKSLIFRQTFYTFQNESVIVILTELFSYAVPHLAPPETVN